MFAFDNISSDELRVWSKIGSNFWVLQPHSGNPSHACSFIVMRDPVIRQKKQKWRLHASLPRDVSPCLQ